MNESSKFISATFVIRNEYRPIGEMLHGSWSLRDAAQRDPVGAHWKCMGSLLLLAFAVEAFIQSVGPGLFGEDWLKGKNYERKGYAATLPAIGTHAGVQVDFTKAPWSAVDSLFKARHGLAHAKPGIRQTAKTVSYPRDADVREIAEVIAAETWEPLLSEAVLAGIEIDVRDAIERLAAGLKLHDVFGHGVRTFSAHAAALP